MSEIPSFGDVAASDALDEKLYGLVEIAEQQQAHAHQILEQLAQERAALAQERERWIGALREIYGNIHASLLDAVSSSMGAIATSIADAIDQATGPAAERIAQAADSADRADQNLRRMMVWTGARFLACGLAGLAGLLALGWLASGIILWWDTKAIATAHVEKLQLQMDVAQLRATRASWIAAGMGTTLRQCGKRKKPCVPVDEAAGAFGNEGDHRIIKPG